MDEAMFRFVVIGNLSQSCIRYPVYQELGFEDDVRFGISSSC